VGYTLVMDLSTLARPDVLRRGDVTDDGERARQGRLARLAVLLALVMVGVIGHDFGWWPALHLPAGSASYLPAVLLITVLIVGIVVSMSAGGRSPHVLYRPEEIGVTLADVVGAEPVVEEVVKTLNLFLAHSTFSRQMGGNARRGILFEGPPGTGKTHMAKAMAAEAGVPFLFVNSSAFQSHYYGQTNRRIRAYFKALRRYARQEGGAIGFIEEIDAIGLSRGLASREVGNVVNELLIQMQSFDELTGSDRAKRVLIDLVNRWLPMERRLKKPRPVPANILVIGATNRATDLDPALLRPGRFDRTITVDLPSRSGRRAIIDYYLARKAHAPELDGPRYRELLASATFGYSPVMLEHLLDEALVWALRRGASRLNWEDIQQAKLTEELGVRQQVTYAERERLTVATHEAGHATVAYLVAPERTLEVLSIIKRRDALGLLAHSDPDERFTHTRTEIEQLIRIAMGGLVAEEIGMGDTSNGVAGDLHAATVAAAQMVGSFGMAGSLVAVDPGPNVVAKVLSDEVCRARVEAILDRARDEVRELMGTHWALVEALRDALLEREELIGAEIDDVLRRAHDRLDEAGVIDLRAEHLPAD